MSNSTMVRVRNLANWCNLSTPLGLVIAQLGGARVVRGPRGTWRAEGYRWRFPVAGAFTVGSVLITGHARWDDLERAKPGALAHEENHTWQWASMFGLPFLPLYLLAMAWSWLRTGDRASANVFERSAGLTLGGYHPAAPRPLREGIAALAAGVRRSRGRGERPRARD